MPTIERQIDVHVPLRTAYNQWTQFESFPQFMEGVRAVRQLDDKHLHWQAMIGGLDKEWQAEITEQTPDTRVAWRSIDGAPNDGVVSFEALDATTTRVFLTLSYEPENMLEKAGDALGFVSWKVEGDLKRFKQFIETQGQESGAWRGEIHERAPASAEAQAPAVGGVDATKASATLRTPGGVTSLSGDKVETTTSRRRVRTYDLSDAASSTKQASSQPSASAALSNAAPVEASRMSTDQLKASEDDTPASRSHQEANRTRATGASAAVAASAGEKNQPRSNRDPIGSSAERDEQRSAPATQSDDIVTFPGVSGPGAVPNADPSWDTPRNLVEDSGTTLEAFDEMSDQLRAKVEENEELLARQRGEKPKPSQADVGLAAAAATPMSEQVGPEAAGGAGTQTGSGRSGGRGRATDVPRDTEK